ncbi:MAG: hypothetical protein ACI4JI_01930 [Ruminiclostridium sp.]
MLIYKDSLLNRTGIKILNLPFETPEEARNNILKIGLQYGFPHIWYHALNKPKKEFLLICIGTGHEHPELTIDDYIGSEIVNDGEYVWHYFLIDKETIETRIANSDKK